MAVIAPPSKGKERSNNKNERNYISQCLSSKMRETICTADGRQMSVAQALTERLVSMALFAESNTDAREAAKLILDRVEGKAAIVKDDSVKEIPKVMIRLNNYQAETLEQKANEPDDDYEDKDPDSLLIAEIDGKTYVG